jgi:hypothetical protein
MGNSTFCQFAHFRVLCFIKVSMDVVLNVCIVFPEKKRVSAQSCLHRYFGKFLPYFHPDRNATRLTVELLGDPPSVPEVAFMHPVRILYVYETDMHGGDTPIWPMHHSIQSPPFPLLRCPPLSAYVLTHMLCEETKAYVARHALF